MIPLEMATKINDLASAIADDVRAHLAPFARSPEIYDIVLSAVQQKVMSIQIPRAPGAGGGREG